jgi:hypothetical protein
MVQQSRPHFSLCRLPLSILFLLQLNRCRVARWYISNPKSQFGQILWGLAMDEVGIFNGHLVYFTANLTTLWPCGTFCGNMIYFYPFWYVVPRKIWQPWSDDESLLQRTNKVRQTRKTDFSKESITKDFLQLKLLLPPEYPFNWSIIGSGSQIEFWCYHGVWR